MPYIPTLIAISNSLQKLWVAWNIPCALTISLTMQWLLTILTPVKRRMSKWPWIIPVMLLAYYVADWAATFALGLITCSKCNPDKVSKDLNALWSALLLMHLAGPDYIMSCALEDKTLWVRHIVGLVGRVLAFLNIFVKMLPCNQFIVPTILIAVAGGIKYVETSRALKLASIAALKKNCLKNLELSSESLKVRENIKKAGHYFQMFKGLLVNIMPDHSQWLKCREDFLKIDAWSALDILTIEMRLFYEVFHTKVLANFSKRGVILRCLEFSLVVVTLILFCLMGKEGISTVHIQITYLLLVGALCLDIVGNLKLSMSSWSRLLFHRPFIWRTAAFWLNSITESPCFEFFRSWRGLHNVGAHNILLQAFEESRPRKGFNNKFGYFLYKINGLISDQMGAESIITFKEQSRNKFEMTLWEFIFEYLQRKSSDANTADTVREVYEARGQGLLRPGRFETLRRYVIDFEYDESLLIWHCATEICFRAEGQASIQNKNSMKLSKILSDYMAYILIKRPMLMYPVGGIGELRYRDTLDEAKKIWKEKSPGCMEIFCRDIHKYDRRADRGNNKSVLPDACKLADALMNSGRVNWEIISQVWVELLSYAAGHSRVESHVSLLDVGNEIITMVWLLMAHLRIRSHVPLERGASHPGEDIA